MVKTMIQAAALATAALVLPRKRATASMASATTALRAVEPEVVDTEEGPVAEISWKTGKLGKTLGKVKKMEMEGILGYEMGKIHDIHGQFIEYD